MHLKFRGLVAMAAALAVVLPVSAAAAHTRDGSVRVEAWGSGSSGQLGEPPVAVRLTPVTVAGLTEAGVEALAGGVQSSHSLALLSDGTVKAWGGNGTGQLGDGTTTNHPDPGTVPGLSGVHAIAAGTNHSLALMPDGTVKAWGLNDHGQLGDGTTTTRTTPVTVLGLSGVRAIAAGGWHSLAVLADGTVKTWGDNNRGQIGDGTTTDRSVPTVVPGLTGVRQVAGGIGFSLALLADGTARAWGQDFDGELGDGTSIPGVDKHSPVTVVGLTNATAIATGGFHSLALLADGTVQSWGDNASGQIGQGNNTVGGYSAPIAVPGLTGVQALAAGEQHSVVALSDGTIRLWGSNNGGQLGDGTLTGKFSPTAIKTGLAFITKIAAGRFHTLAA